MTTTNRNEPKFHSFKKSEDGSFFVQWKKGGKFIKADPQIAAFIAFYAITK